MQYSKQQKTNIYCCHIKPTSRLGNLGAAFLYFETLNFQDMSHKFLKQKYYHE